MSGSININEEGHTKCGWLEEENKNLQAKCDAMSDAVAVLVLLVDLKSYKDKLGKTEKYKIAQPVLWNEARESLSKLNTEPPKED